MPPQFDNLLPLAVSAARTAGTQLARRGADWRAVDSAEGRDIKLAADRLSEGLLAEALAPSGIPVFSEEGGWLAEQAEGLRWVIDPLDGTANYSREVPLCCVSVALLDGLRPVLGVVYDFSRGEVFAGAVGLGATLNDVPMHVSAEKAKDQALLATGFPLRRSFSDQALLEFGQEVRQWKKVRMLGSAALSLAYVAAGRLDAYWEQGIMAWDVAAGWALVEAAGGVVKTDIAALAQPLEVFASGPGLR